MIADEDLTLPDLLRATAAMIRMEHDRHCPGFREWRRAALLLERVADDPAGPERAHALEVAGAYLRSGELVGAS